MAARGYLISRGSDDSQASKPQRQAPPASAVRESAPKIGSDGSPSECEDEEERAVEEAAPVDGDAAPESTSPPSSKLRGRLRQCDDELQKLRIDYDAEVQTCADLREQLEERDAEISEAT